MEGQERYGNWGRRVAIGSLFGLCLLPFLVPFRTLPVSSFYAEWLAIALGLFALVGLAGQRSLVFPRVAALPAGISLILVCQLLWLPDAVSSAVLIALLYLLWAILLMVLTAGLIKDVGLVPLADWLAMALAIAAAMNACNVILFQAGVKVSPEWSFLVRLDQAGNLGQANQLADLLWLGIASALYRWQRSREGRWLVVIGFGLMLLASALSGARLPLVYALWLVVAAMIWGDAQLRKASMWVAASYFVITALVYVLPFKIIGATDSLSRVVELGTHTGSKHIRLELIASAWNIFLDHPWTGAGWGSFAWESYQRVGVLGGLEVTGEHAHQLFAQLAAELGFAAPLIALITLSALALSIWRARIHLNRQAEYWWAISAAGIMLLHAQFEYPFWYAYLLGIFSILLVCAEQRVVVLSGVRVSGAIMIAALAGTGFWLVITGIDYIRLEQWVVRDMRRTGTVVPPGHYQLLADLSQDSLLRDMSVRMLAAVMAPTTEQLLQKQAVCRQALLSGPQQPAVFTCALLDGLAGDPALAAQEMRRAKLVFESDFPAYTQKLALLLTEEQLTSVQRMLLVGRQDGVKGKPE